MTIKIQRWKNVFTLIKSSPRRVKRKMCGKKNQIRSTSMMTHLTRMKYIQRPLWSTCMTDRKTVSGALCDAAKIVLWQILNDKIMKLEMKMKVERLKLRLTGPVNYVLYIFKMFDRKWMNSNIRVIYLKFSLCILDATC